MKIGEMLQVIGAALIFLCLLVFGFNWLHCTPIKIIENLLPKVAVAPVTAVIPPGSVVEYHKNTVVIKPPKSLPGKPQPPVRKIWHPIELKPYTDQNGILHVPQSGFCFCLLGGGTYDLKTFDWEVTTRVFVAGQLGFEPSFNDRIWSPKIGWRLFDSNILIDIGPNFKHFSFDYQGVSAGVKFDTGLF